MLPLGTMLPSFRLPDLDGREVSSDDFKTAPGLLVAFICPHCPYVKHMRVQFGALAKEYRERGLAIVAINANDTASHPGDGPSGMKEEAVAAGYTFPYLLDEPQAERLQRASACRERIERNFSLERAVEAFDALHLHGTLPELPSNPFLTDG